jgi:hypothetical protein
MVHRQATTKRSDMIDANAFAKLVPGFDFLNTLMQGAAGQAAPAMGQWIAPTLNPDELEKRIGELKTVQFWLEQNARMISVTVQALEVQRMTLSTLQSMNLPMADLRSALTLPTAPPAPAAATPPTPPAPPPEPAAPAEAAGDAPAKPAVDPMQWWGALTQQFTELATKAMQDSSALASRNLAKTTQAPAAPAKAAIPTGAWRCRWPPRSCRRKTTRRPSRRWASSTSATTTPAMPTRCMRRCASAGRAWPGPAAWAWA